MVNCAAWSSKSRASLALGLALEVAGGAAIAVPWAFAGDPGQAPPSGAALGLKEAGHDFGRVTGGTVVHHVWAFTNLGTAPLAIRNVEASCSCVTIGAWTSHVEPGATGIIPVSLDAHRPTGPVEETVAVTSNDPAQPRLVLMVRGTVWWPIEVAPASARFDFGPESGTNAFRVVQIVNHLETPLALGRPSSSHPAIAVELRTREPGRRFELEVRTRPPLPPGNVFGQVRLATSASQMPTLEVPVYAMLQPTVSASPAALLVPAGPLHDGHVQTVGIRAFWTNTLELSEAKVNLPGVTLELVELERGATFRAWLRFPKDFALPPGQRGEFSVRSNHPRFPYLTVPITQAARPTTP